MNQTLEKKKYYKSKIKSIYVDDDFEPVSNIGALPEDTSIVFFVLQKKRHAQSILTAMERVPTPIS